MQGTIDNSKTFQCANTGCKNRVPYAKLNRGSQFQFCSAECSRKLMRNERELKDAFLRCRYNAFKYSEDTPEWLAVDAKEWPPESPGERRMLVLTEKNQTTKEQRFAVIDYPKSGKKFTPACTANVTDSTSPYKFWQNNPALLELPQI